VIRPAVAAAVFATFVLVAVVLARDYEAGRVAMARKVARVMPVPSPLRLDAPRMRKSLPAAWQAEGERRERVRCAAAVDADARGLPCFTKGQDCARVYDAAGCVPDGGRMRCRSYGEGCGGG